MRFPRPFRRDCPPLEDVFRLLRGDLPPERTGALGRHVDACPACLRARAWLEDLAGTVAAGPLPDPREEAVERAVAFFPPRRPAREPGRGWSLASLLRDSFAQPVPVGVRGEATGARRLLFRTEDADLDLEVRAAAVGEPAFHVTGQLLPRGGAAARDLLAVLWREGVVAAQAASDPMGVFDFPRVAPGAYRLELWMPDDRGIRVEPLELDAEAS